MEFKVKLSSVKDAQDFVKAATLVDGSVDVSHNRYIVDGMSLLGILSLDLSQPLNVKIIGDETSAAKFRLDIYKFVV